LRRYGADRGYGMIVARGVPVGAVWLPDVSLVCPPAPPVV
jgi:hypothetical protein